MELVQNAGNNPRTTLQTIAELKRRKRFEEIAALEPTLPDPLTPEWLPVADEISFALGHQHQCARAIHVLLRAWMLEPTQRRASALAYLHYDALFGLARSRGSNEGDRQSLRKGFRKWIEEALRRDPKSVKDLYRLGEFEAQLESMHDKPALRAFLAAIDAYNSLPAEVRETRGDLRKAMVKSLYAGARSALRLRQLQLARRLAFDAIRQDKETNWLEPIHKLSLAGKICLATGELDAAERALRLALDAKGPPQRDWIFGLLASVCLRRKDAAGAARWIEAHVLPHRRTPALWRQLGDAHRAAGNLDGALACYESALRRDRMGRHLTLQRIGEICRERGDLKRAERAFADAAEFKRRHFLSESEEALDALGEVAERRGRPEQAGQARDRAQRARRHRWRDKKRRAREAASGASAQGGQP